MSTTCKMIAFVVCELCLSCSYICHMLNALRQSKPTTQCHPWSSYSHINRTSHGIYHKVVCKYEEGTRNIACNHEHGAFWSDTPGMSIFIGHSLCHTISVSHRRSHVLFFTFSLPELQLSYLQEEVTPGSIWASCC